MAIVLIPGVLRERAQGQESVEVPGKTVREVLEGLVQRYPGLRGRILDEGGQLHSFLSVMVDQCEIVSLSDEVGPDSEVVIVPALGGGVPSLDGT